MSVAGRIGWGIVKWVLIPAGLGAVGYYYIGPQFGKASGLKPQDVLRIAGQPVPRGMGGMPEPPPLDPPKRSLGEPEVEVTVSRSRTVSTPTRQTRPKRSEPSAKAERKSRPPVEPAPRASDAPAEAPPEEEPPDEAGAGGMTDPDGGN